jgi:hypothetical protein
VNAHVYARGLACGTCAPRDEADLATVLPLLDKRARTWLRGVVEHVPPGTAGSNSCPDAERRRVLYQPGALSAPPA